MFDKISKANSLKEEHTGFYEIKSSIFLLPVIKLDLIFFSFSRRGFVFGLWSACASVGNILGAFLASTMLKYGYEVRHTPTLRFIIHLNVLGKHRLT